MNAPSLVDLSKVDPAPSTAALRHLARVVAAATANPPGAWVCTAVCCRRRPDRRRCPGRIRTRRQDLPEQIQWSCPACGDGGVGRNWRRSPWRLDAGEASAGEVGVTLPEDVYRALEAAELPDPQARQMVLGATQGADGVELWGSSEAVRRLQGQLTHLGRRTGSARIRHGVALAARLIAAGLARR